MGIDVIKIGESDSSSGLKPSELAELSFHEYSVENAGMHIWMMAASRDRTLLPWWSYDSSVEDGIRSLNDVWSVNSSQAFFDCLSLSSIRRQAANSFYVIFPGNIKTDGWLRLTESDKNVFLRGQGCVYHLQGAFSNRLSINWVPFWQPQSLVRDPSFGSFWRMFIANQWDDVTNSISFFSLSDQKKLPQVVNLLIAQSDNRSEELVKLVDWFGMYSSPLGPGYSPCGVIYTKHAEVMASLRTLRKNIETIYDAAKTDLAANPTPTAALRFLSRHIAL